jgi:hypothetical protein
MEMTWIDARDFLTAAHMVRRLHMLDMAAAVRVAQTDKRDWEQWVKEVSARK